VGASVRNVLGMVVLEAMRPAAIGVAIGLVGALALAQALATQVYGIQPADPLTFAVVSGLLLGVALAASIIPGWRATRVDPMRALREE
jgi:ABC-type antimicrobial peptide transport system permease subunit